MTNELHSIAQSIFEIQFLDTSRSEDVFLSQKKLTKTRLKILFSYCYYNENKAKEFK